MIEFPIRWTSNDIFPINISKALSSTFIICGIYNAFSSRRLTRTPRTSRTLCPCCLPTPSLITYQLPMMCLALLVVLYNQPLPSIPLPSLPHAFTKPQPLPHSIKLTKELSSHSQTPQNRPQVRKQERKPPLLHLSSNFTALTSNDHISFKSDPN